MFRARYFPRAVMNPQEANLAFVRGQVELVPLREVEGRIAAEGALPYLRVCCVWFREKYGAVQYSVTSSL